MAIGQVSGGTSGVTGGVSSGGGSTVPALLKTGLIGEYLLLDGSGTTAADSSGSNNNGTLGTTTHAPTWISGGTGGLSFSRASTQFVSFPAALNAARTIQIVYSMQTTTSITGDMGIFESTTNPGVDLLMDNSCQYAVHGQCNPAASDTSNPGILLFGTSKNFSKGIANGTGVFVTYLLGTSGDSTQDNVCINSYCPVFSTSGGGTQQSGGVATGVYQLGGSTLSNDFFQGSVYCVLVYNTYLTSIQIKSNYQWALQNCVTGRGITPFYGNTTASRQFMAEGDSLTNGNSGSVGFPWTNSVALNNYDYITNLGQNGEFLSQMAPDAPFTSIASFGYTSGNAAVIVWGGTNDCVLGSQTAAQIVTSFNSYCRQVHALSSALCIPVTMISRQATDATCKDTLNPLLRQQWATFADGLVDLAADPLLGADNAALSSTYFNADHIHPLSAGEWLIVEHMQKTINRVFGNTSWNSATTYTTGAAAATAITAASESTNTMTITTTLNPPVGSCVTITGVTPAGYNNPAGVCWIVQTTSASNFTAFNSTSGLGAGSVFGTVSVPLQKDQDQYVILAGSATSPSFTLETCQGWTGNIFLKNQNTTSPWVITPWQSSETIDGATSLTMPTASSGNFPVVVLQSQLISNTAGGCIWKRLQ